MTYLMQDVKEIRKSQQEYRVEIGKFRKKNEQIRKENKGLKSKIKRINNRLKGIDREKRRTDIVVQGLSMGYRNKETFKNNMKDSIEENLVTENKSCANNRKESKPRGDQKIQQG